MNTSNNPQKYGKSVATTSPAKADSIMVYLSEKAREQFESIDTPLAFRNEAMFAVQHYMKNQALQGCSKESFIASLINVALTGITLNPALGYAYLIPRRVSGKMECTLDISYKGLLHILTDSGGVKNIYAHCVYEKDVFKCEYGLSPVLQHVPFMGRNKGEIKGAYGVAVLPDGSKTFDYMDIEELNYIKSRSESGKRGVGPWVSDFAEMARKTIIKRMFKYLAKSDKMSKAAEVIEYDHEANGIDFEKEHRQQAVEKKQSDVTKAVQSAINKAKAAPAAVVKPNEDKEAVKDAQIEALERIANATSVEQLDEIMRHLPDDVATEAVYAAANIRNEELQ